MKFLQTGISILALVCSIGVNAEGGRRDAITVYDAAGKSVGPLIGVPGALFVAVRLETVLINLFLASEYFGLPDTMMKVVERGVLYYKAPSCVGAPYLDVNGSAGVRATVVIRTGIDQRALVYIGSGAVPDQPLIFSKSDGNECTSVFMRTVVVPVEAAIYLDDVYPPPYTAR